MTGKNQREWDISEEAFPWLKRYWIWMDIVEGCLARSNKRSYPKIRDLTRPERGSLREGSRLDWAANDRQIQSSALIHTTIFPSSVDENLKTNGRTGCV